MKKPITILICCALLAPLAFAQPESKGKGQGASTTEEVTVTGAIIKMTSEEGSAANYQPVKTLVVREDRSNTPGSYVLSGRGHVVNKKGEVIQTAIKPGTRVHIYYANVGDSRMVDRVVID
ncbi:MAG: hypothetical protein ACXWHF_06965 [Chthoniobacterales bacterium]